MIKVSKGIYKTSRKLIEESLQKESKKFMDLQWLVYHSIDPRWLYRISMRHTARNGVEPKNIKRTQEEIVRSGARLVTQTVLYGLLKRGLLKMTEKTKITAGEFQMLGEKEDSK